MTKELEAFRDMTVPDLIGPGIRLLFVGINTGLWTAAVGAHFAPPEQPFLPGAARRGHHPVPSASNGLNEADRLHLLEVSASPGWKS